MTLLELVRFCDNIDCNTTIKFEKNDIKYCMNYVDVLLDRKAVNYNVESFKLDYKRGKTTCNVKLIDESEVD